MHTREQLSTIHRNLTVSYDEGEQLGRVANAYFDKSNCGIKGLTIAPKLTTSDGELFVSFSDIHRLGQDVLIVSSQTALKKPPQKLEGSSLRDLKRTKVVTKDGQHLGELLDVNVFAKSGIISDIILYGSKKLKIDVEKDNISIGPDLIVVPSGYQNRVKALKDSEKKGFVANAERTTRNVTESIRNAVLGVTANKAKKEAKTPAKKKPDEASKKSIQPGKGSKPKSSPSPSKKIATKKATATSSKKRPSKKAAKKVPKK